MGGPPTNSRGDNGQLPDSPRRLKGVLTPMKAKTISEVSSSGGMREQTRIIGRVVCYGEKDVVVRNGFMKYRDVDHLNEIKAGKSEFLNPPEYYEVKRDLTASDDELRLAIDQPPCIWNRETQEWDECTLEESQASPDGFDYRSPYSSPSHARSDRDRVRFELESRIKQQALNRNILINQGHKPCRYKACNGRSHTAHGEKCPISSARGSTGGSKKGATKARKGNKNGRAKAPRSCCGTLHSKPHAITCSKAKISLRKDSAKLTLRKARKESVTPKKVEISWAGFAVPTSLFKAMSRNITGTCGGCKTEMSATKASKIHRADVQPNKTDARLICGVCL